MVVKFVVSMLLGTEHVVMSYQWYTCRKHEKLLLCFWFIPSSSILLPLDTVFSFAIFISEADDQFCPPCGSCRQVIAEFGYSSNCLILLVKPSGEYKETAITELLPEPFTRHVLSGKHKIYWSYHCGIVDNYNMLHAHVRAIVPIFSNVHSARASHLSYHIFFFLQYKYVITLRLSFLVFKRHWIVTSHCDSLALCIKK